MPIVKLIILGIPLLSLAWWIWADRRLSRMSESSGKTRIALGLAVLLLLAGFIWVIAGRRDWVHMPIPAPLYSLVLLWGLVFLPLLGLPSMLAWSFWSVGRRIFSAPPTPQWSRRRWLRTTLFTGDLIDNTIRDLPAAVEMLRKFEPASRLFVIEGNHDLFDDPAAFEKRVRDGGIALLRNQTATVQIRGVPVQLLGILWNHGEQKMSRDVDAVAALRDPAAFPILLAHHPHAFDRAAELGIPLTLAGHTHGGQVMLTPDFGAGSAMFRYWTGLYQNAGNALVVGNGTGNWFPLRLNAPAEIIHLTLRRA